MRRCFWDSPDVIGLCSSSLTTPYQIDARLGNLEIQRDSFEPDLGLFSSCALLAGGSCFSFALRCLFHAGPATEAPGHCHVAPRSTSSIAMSIIVEFSGRVLGCRSLVALPILAIFTKAGSVAETYELSISTSRSLCRGICTRFWKRRRNAVCF